MKRVAEAFMANSVCLKCGSTRIDDGRDRLLCVLGLSLIAAGFLAMFLSVPYFAAVDYASFSPTVNGGMVVVPVLAFGFFLTTKGMTRAERLICRNCRTVWTPPRQGRIN